MKEQAEIYTGREPTGQEYGKSLVEYRLHPNAQAVADAVINAGAYITYFDRPRGQWPVWTDGTVSPAYCNMRATLSNPDSRRVISRAMIDLVTENVHDYKDGTIVVALATAGISWGTTIADALGLPLAYDRGKPKAYGTGDRIEGSLGQMRKAILVDDAMASGGSMGGASDFLNSLGIQIAAIVAGVAISDPSCKNRWNELGNIRILAATDFHHLLAGQLREGRLNEDQMRKLIAFYRDNKAEIDW
jgi:orotate phosphoribosyltransferase